MTNKSSIELLRRADMTGRARYNAARRMQVHAVAANWTLALLAIGQIIIGLMQVFKFPSNFRIEYIGFTSILFAVFVLTYSLLVGMSNFSSRAVKMHGCGLELGRLVRKLNYYTENSSLPENLYQESAQKYYDILDKHENHARSDYLLASYQTAKDITFIEKSWFVLRIIFYRAVEYSHYFITLSIVYGWIYLMIKIT